MFMKELQWGISFTWEIKSCVKGENVYEGTAMGNFIYLGNKIMCERSKCL